MTLQAAFLLVALILFLLAGLGVNSPRLNLMAMGLFFLTLSMGLFYLK